MRWSILRPLVAKELHRHLANRAGLSLVLLLIVAALLLSLFRGRGGDASALRPPVQVCYVDYADDSPLVAHLRASVPADLAAAITFRPLGEVPTDACGALLYPTGSAAIQLRPPTVPGGPPCVWFWHPGGDRAGLAPYEAWFWKAAYHHALVRPTAVPMEDQAFSLTGGLDPGSGLATALVLFGLFFVCVYLLPSMTCEEHERGVLLAQALSPATTAELLAARFLFYPALGVALAALLAGVQSPRVLVNGLFWLALVVCAFGAMGVGLTIASLARSQRAASLAAMSYLLSVTLLLSICQQNGIPVLPWLALEYHGPRMLHAVLAGQLTASHWLHLLAATLLGAAWTGLAAVLFRRHGWQ